MCKTAKIQFIHDGDLNLIPCNKNNYTCYSCQEPQGVGALRCKFHSSAYFNSNIRRKNITYTAIDLHADGSFTYILTG